MLLLKEVDTTLPFYRICEVVKVKSEEAKICKETIFSTIFQELCGVCAKARERARL